MLLAEIFWVFVPEHLVEVLAGVGQFLCAGDNQRIVWNVDYALKSRHLLRIHLRRHHVSHEEELGVGVVHYVVYLVWRELMEYWHGYGSIGQHGEESRCPCRAVAAAEGYLVAFLNAGALEHDVKLLYLACHVVVLQGSTLVIGESVAIPVPDDAVLDELVEAWYLFHSNNYLSESGSPWLLVLSIIEIPLYRLLWSFLKLLVLQLYLAYLAKRRQQLVEILPVLLHDGVEVALLEAQLLCRLGVGINQAHKMVASLHDEALANHCHGVELVLNLLRVHVLAV